MPLELSSLLKDTCGWSFSSRGMNSLFCNKFYTSGILTIIIIVIVMIIYPCKKGTPAYIGFKLGFYVFLAGLAIIFIHDGIMNNVLKKEQQSREAMSMMEVIGGENNIAFSGEKVEVNPQLENHRDVGEFNKYPHETHRDGGDGMTGDGVCTTGGSDDITTENLFNAYGV